jgi:hypothetical protein
LPGLLHAVPSGSVGFVHWPVLGSHVPAWWQSSSAVHVTSFEPVQEPDWHVSVCVQELPSLQDEPSPLFGFEQKPVCGSHVPATWH